MGKTRSRLILLVAVLSVILGSLIGGVAAKYIWSTELSGRITFSAKLAQSITLQEHQALQRQDGSYGLQPTKIVTENSYVLLPGLDVPKDPFIVVKGKTPIEAYLFLEVKDLLGSSALSYSLTDSWESLGNINPDDSGVTVYVYKQPLTEGFSEEPIHILSGDQITVSHTLKPTTISGGLSFSALMVESAFASGDGLTLAQHAANVYQAYQTETP